MNDWRLFNQDEHLNHIRLRKIIFPEFWDASYVERNAFFQRVLQDAEEHVKRTGRFANLLRDKSIQDFWHAHCDFCTIEIDTRKKGTFYCTEDYMFWICKICFDDFNKHFDWEVQ